MTVSLQSLRIPKTKSVYDKLKSPFEMIIHSVSSNIFVCTRLRQLNFYVLNWCRFEGKKQNKHNKGKYRNDNCTVTQQCYWYLSVMLYERLNRQDSDMLFNIYTWIKAFCK